MLRAVPAPNPQAQAEAFVADALPIIRREQARHGLEADASIRLQQIIGAGWQISAEGRAIAAGSSFELGERSKWLVKSAVCELSVEDRSYLMGRMHSADREGEGEASYFSVTLALCGESWVLTIRAHARGSAAICASFEGVLSVDEPAAA